MVKQCPNCGTIWEAITDFLNAPDIFLQGYQSNFSKIEGGYYLFLHNKKGCNTSFTIPIEQFKGLYKGPIYYTTIFETEDCEKRCLDSKNMGPCSQPCKHAYIREIMSFFKKEPR